MYKTSMMKYLQIVQNVPENSPNTKLLGCVSKQAKRSDRGRDENFVNFEFLEGQYTLSRFLTPS